MRENFKILEQGIKFCKIWKIIEHTRFVEVKKCNLMKILECCVLKATFQSESGTREKTN